MEYLETELGCLVKDIDGLIKTRNYKLAYSTATDLLKKAEEGNFLYYKAKAFGLLGYTNHLLNELTKAIDNFEKSLEIYSNTPQIYCLEIKQTLNSLSMLYKERGYISRALEALSQSIQISDTYGLVNSIAYNNLGVVYLCSKEYDKALNSFKRALIIEESSSETNLNNCFKYLSNEANAYLKLGKLDYALEIFEKTVNFFQEKGEMFFLVNSYKGMATIMIRNEKYNLAEHYLKLALRIIRELKTHVFIVDLNVLLSSVYKWLEQKDSQFLCLKKALSYAKEFSPTKLLVVYENLLGYYYENGSYRNAFRITQNISQLEVRNRDVEQKENFLEIQEKFESHQTDKLIEQEKSFNNELILRNRKLQEAINEREGLNLQLKSLQMQLSPHFIFNTLQSIQSFIFNRAPLQSGDYLASFAQLMRTNLASSKQNFTSVKEEISLLENYMALEQMRFSNQFRYKIWVQSKELLKHKIPVMLVQVFVENSIVHGISTLPQGEIQVLFRGDAELLYIHIIDNGIGMNVAKEKKKSRHKDVSSALKIMRERSLLSQYSKYSSFTYKIRNANYTNEMNGTHVLIRVHTR